MTRQCQRWSPQLQTTHINLPGKISCLCPNSRSLKSKSRNIQHHRQLNYFSLHNSVWKIKYSKHFTQGVPKLAPTSAGDKSRAFNGDFKQVRSRSWCTCSKNCNRRRTWLYQYDPENKAQSKQWLPRYGSVWLKERQTCQDQRSWQQFFCYVLFWMLKAFCLLIFLETKRIIPSAD